MNTDYKEQEDADLYKGDFTIDKEKYDKILKIEQEREKDPVYLAEKEIMLMKKLEREKSVYNHPCQNENNTVTLVSSDKLHEVDIEYNNGKDNGNNNGNNDIDSSQDVLLNFIKIEPSASKTFREFMKSVYAELKKDNITNIYQCVTVSDWEFRLSEIEGFELVKHVKNALEEEYILVKTDIESLVDTIIEAFGMNVESHLDKDGTK